METPPSSSQPMEADNAQPTSSDAPLVAPPARYYRMTRYIMAIVFIGMGAWFGYDGWIGWPDGNARLAQINDDLGKYQKLVNDETDTNKQAEYRDKIGKLSEEQKLYTHHNDAALFIQKALCVVLPPLGIGLVVLALYRSRGAYRLEGKTLHVPGHPPVPLDAITRVDRKLWDRKGIAVLEYELGGKRGRLKLDDFLYDRPPTDRIFEQIEQYLHASTAQHSIPLPRTQGAGRKGA